MVAAQHCSTIVYHTNVIQNIKNFVNVVLFFWQKILVLSNQSVMIVTLPGITMLNLNRPMNLQAETNNSAMRSIFNTIL